MSTERIACKIQAGENLWAAIGLLPAKETHPAGEMGWDVPEDWL